MTMNAREFLQTDVVLLGILVYALLGKLADVLDAADGSSAACLAPGLPDRRNEATARDELDTRLRSTCEPIRTADPRGRRLAAQPAPAAAGGVAGRAARRDRRRSATRQVLDRLDLAIAPAQFVAIVGRSGCGKSTLLRLHRRARAADRRRAAIDGSAGRRRCSRPCGIMFQDARLLPWQRVLGNVGIARGRGLARASAARRSPMSAWPTAPTTGRRCFPAASGSASRWPARWCSRPQLLLLDEPFGALDALTRIEMHRLIERIWREHGFTAMLITHDVAEAVALADRVIVIRDGGIALDLPVDLPRPRREGADPSAAALQARILDEV